jgi:hypothetical protein
MWKRIRQRKGVFDRRIFEGLRAYDVIGRELAGMLQRGELIKVGRGRYQRAEQGSGERSFESATEYLDERIRESERVVFLRRDLQAPVSYDATGRAIQRLVRRGALVRLAPGVYAKARKSSITGEPVPAGSPERIIREAADRMGLQIRESGSMRAYNEGRSEQVPTGRRIAVEGRPRAPRLTIGNGVFEFVPE